MNGACALGRGLLLAAGLVVAAGAAGAGSIKGLVRNESAPAPNNGLGGVAVSAVAADGSVVKTVPTEPDGTYRLSDLPDGTYTLSASCKNFRDDPDKSVRVPVAGDATADDIHLVRKDDDDMGYRVVAANMLRRVDALPAEARAKALQSEWVRLRTINLPPSSRAYVARGLKEKSAGAADVIPDLKLYLEADPKRLKGFEEKFLKDVDGGKSVPGPGALEGAGVRHELVADVALFGLKASSMPPEAKTQLVDEFHFKWKGTDAGKMFLDYQKQGLMKGPRVRPPE